MLGTNSGHLLVLDPLTLDRISIEHLFDSQHDQKCDDGQSPPNPIQDELQNQITNITFEPTQSMLLSARHGEVRMINIVK